MKNLKKKSLSLVLAGLTLAGLVMPVDAADVSSKSGKAGAVHRISSTPWEGEEHFITGMGLHWLLICTCQRIDRAECRLWQ